MLSSFEIKFLIIKVLCCWLNLFFVCMISFDNGGYWSIIILFLSLWIEWEIFLILWFFKCVDKLFIFFCKLFINILVNIFVLFLFLKIVN